MDVIIFFSILYIYIDLFWCIIRLLIFHNCIFQWLYDLYHMKIMIFVYDIFLQFYLTKLCLKTSIRLKRCLKYQILKRLNKTKNLIIQLSDSYLFKLFIFHTLTINVFKKLSIRLNINILQIKIHSKPIKLYVWSVHKINPHPQRTARTKFHAATAINRNTLYSNNS